LGNLQSLLQIVENLGHSNRKTGSMRLGDGLWCS